MLSTLGMPTRSWERSLTLTGVSVAAEAFFANHVGNIRESILGLLDSSFDHFHFTQIFHQALGAGVVDDHPLPSGNQRDLAPRPPFAFDEFHVNEAALAIHRAPVANGVDRS